MLPKIRQNGHKLTFCKMPAISFFAFSFQSLRRAALPDVMQIQLENACFSDVSAIWYIRSRKFSGGMAQLLLKLASPK